MLMVVKGGVVEWEERVSDESKASENIIVYKVYIN